MRGAAFERHEMPPYHLETLPTPPYVLVLATGARCRRWLRNQLVGLRLLVGWVGRR